jgi:hypothetical protein
LEDVRTEILCIGVEHENTIKINHAVANLFGSMEQHESGGINPGQLTDLRQTVTVEYIESLAPYRDFSSWKGNQDTDPNSEREKFLQEYKEWANALPKDKILLKGHEINYFKYIVKQLSANKFFNYIMKNAILEEKIIFNYNVTDEISIECSAIPDIVNLEKKVIIDLKTCQCASKNKFQKDCANLDYHLQSAMYIQACKEKYGDGDWTFMFLAVENTQPYLFQFFECDEQFVSIGKNDVEMLLLLWNDCLVNGFNRGYEVFCQDKMKIEKLSLPAWKTFENINFY